MEKLPKQHLMICTDPEAQFPVHAHLLIHVPNRLAPIEKQSLDAKEQIFNLAEAMVYMIHLQDKLGTKKSHESLEECIELLKEGFQDAEYFKNTRLHKEVFKYVQNPINEVTD